MAGQHKQVNLDIVAFIKDNKQKYTYKQLAQKFDTSRATVSSLVNRSGLQGFLVPDTGRGKIEVDAHLKGETVMREPTQADLTRLRQICEERNLPFEKWGIFWDKTKDSSIAFYNKAAVEELKNLHQEMVADMKKHAPKYPAVRYKKVTDPHLKLIDVADLHIGKLALALQTGHEYNVEIATKRAHDGVTALIKRSQGFPTERFLFPIGNDILHVDNGNNTTTKGTRQDVDGMAWMHFRIAKRMYVEMIERLLKIAPVDVVFNGSNHDELSGFHLAETLESHFHRAKNITFDIDPIDRKYYQYGKNMIGTQHGDGAKMADLPLLMAVEDRQMWAATDHHYVVIHHLHHWKKTEYVYGKDYPGVTVQHMRSLSAPDPWHAKKGYVGAPQAIDALIFHPEYGQVDHMSCKFAQ